MDKCARACTTVQYLTFPSKAAYGSAAASCRVHCGSPPLSHARTLSLSVTFSRSQTGKRRGRRWGLRRTASRQSPAAAAGWRLSSTPPPRSRSLLRARSLSLARSLSSLGVSPSLSLIPRLSVRETCARTSIRVAKGHFALLGGHQAEIVGVNGSGRQKDPSSLRTRKFPRTPPPPSPCSAPQGWC